MIDSNTAFIIAGSLIAAVFFVWSNERLAVLVVCATFVSRPAISVGGFSVRLELLVGVLCLLRMIHETMSRRGRSIPLSMTLSVSFVSGWLLFAGITSMNIPPMPQKSMSVLIWCALNVITAVWIARTPSIWLFLLKAGSIAALVVSILAIIFWIAASSYIFNYGVQRDPAYGGFAAYAFSIEANVLGGLLCMWALVAIYNPLNAVPRFVRLSLAALVPVAIIATHTRAALVAYVVGLAACLIFRKGARKVAAVSALLGGFAAVYLLVSSSDRGLGKFSNVFDISGGTGELRYRVNSIALTEWWSSTNRIIGLGWNSFGQRHIDDTQPGLLLPGYIGNLPIQIVYDAGLVGLCFVVLAVVAVVVQLSRARRTALFFVFGVPYLAFSVATSTLWLLETWVFVGLAWATCVSLGAGSSILTSGSHRSARDFLRSDLNARQVL